MGFWSRIKQEFIEIIEWVDEGRETIVYKFPIHSEIKNNAKLTVREGQQAVFMYKGQIADIYSPGMYSLSTDNMPVLSTLMGWKYGFESPFKADVYFVTTRQFSDMKWGTPQPIEIFDQQFGPVRVRANGIYSVQVVDPAKLIREMAGTDPNFNTDEIANTLREHIIADFTETLVQGGWGVFEMKAKMTEISKKVQEVSGGSFAQFGIEVRAIKIRSMTLPEAVQKAMDTSASMGMIGNMGRFQQYQMANAVGGMADNPGGAMGSAMGAGAGLGMGFGMMGAMAPQMRGMMAPMAYPQQPGYGWAPPQGYPQQGYPQQQGMPPQGYPQQGQPPLGYPPQGQPPQGMPPQGQPPQGMPPQGQSPQATAPSGRNPNIMDTNIMAQMMQIQQLLAAGQITPEKAQQMLSALQPKPQPPQGQPPQADPPPQQP